MREHYAYIDIIYGCLGIRGKVRNDAAVRRGDDLSVELPSFFNIVQGRWPYLRIRFQLAHLLPEIITHAFLFPRWIHSPTLTVSAITLPLVSAHHPR
jgi:hypothetical protein